MSSESISFSTQHVFQWKKVEAQDANRPFKHACHHVHLIQIRAISQYRPLQSPASKAPFPSISSRHPQAPSLAKAARTLRASEEKGERYIPEDKSRFKRHRLVVRRVRRTSSVRNRPASAPSRGRGSFHRLKWPGEAARPRLGEEAAAGARLDV